MTKTYRTDQNLADARHRLADAINTTRLLLMSARSLAAGIEARGRLRHPRELNAAKTPKDIRRANQHLYDARARAKRARHNAAIVAGRLADLEAQLAALDGDPAAQAAQDL